MEIKKKLSRSQVWNLSMGFLGIQFGFALQNANASRIFQTFGAEVHQLSWFWLAAPLTGLIVQPIVGHFSDRTWTRWGRRKPYFVTGAIIASVALVMMPNAQMLSFFLPPLLIGAGLLMIMDTSFNLSMEPFRALVADVLPDEQRTYGFSVQTFLIGLGAVVGSWLPFALGKMVGRGESDVPLNVTLSFVTGAVILFVTILWSAIKTKEYPFQHQPERDKSFFLVSIGRDFVNMPKKMAKLGAVQFLSWFGLFSMWVYSTPAIAQHVYLLVPTDTISEEYNQAADWVGFLFGVYNLVAVLYALFIPRLAAKIGRKTVHAISLAAGGLGLGLIFLVRDPNLLILNMVGVGIAWASILSMPYAMLANALPEEKVGIYMGIFNFFIVIPQILNGVFGGVLLKHIFADQPVYSLLFGGILLVLGALLTFTIDDKVEPAPETA